ncbi:TPA: SprT family protein [Staphylococcus delphini]|uniref:SprT family protein n=1 Tax=Staphylococcus delphini TaxID=53344 RepID=UPI000BBCE937|nr:SprT family protein [Staphylococcus delphini]PCF45161.1 SprT family protein [Staphylococcus delphini]PCF72170.1 SprT family protein [Staphylococcus delphini]HEC2156566.1 SprT family protein [Staphylococcus delphini]HEC2176630.1 SprT family protein [Staphylococcus delphini]
MNNESLQQLTEQLAIEHFGIPFKHHIYFNRRLRTTGGRYMLTTHDIEINPKQYEHFGEQALVDIIKHELCHYFLHLSGRGHQHKDRDFKVLAEKVGAPRFCQPTESYASRANYEYECQSCHSSYVRIRKVNVVKMRCGRCGGRLKLKRYL